VPGKSFLWWSDLEAAKAKQKQGRVREMKAGHSKMFTGTLIEDLIATVERAEQASPDTMIVADSLIADSWFASVQENTDYDSKLLGVA
jgi:hypothetical protein